MKNVELDKEFYLHINNYNINIERFLIELYYREIIDYLVEYSVLNLDETNSIEIKDLSELINMIDDNNIEFKNKLLSLTN